MATATFAYADAERVTQKGTNNLTYDAPSPASGCATGTPATKPHAAKSAGSDTYPYDCAGNVISRMVSGATTLFSYDAENRLIRVTGSVTETHTYNGDGVRVRSVVTTTGGVTTTVYIGNYFEWVSASVTRTYYYAGNARVAERIGATVYYLLGDHLGSTSVSYRSDGGQTSRQWYGPWGNTRAYTGTLPTDYTFTGQRLDGGTTLLDYQARWYDPVLGRFYAADTIVPQPGNPQSLNRYSYVLNNPLRFVDPTGYDPLDANWEEQFRREHEGRDPTDEDRYLRLLSLLAPGSGSGGSWTSDDFREAYYAYQRAMNDPYHNFLMPGSGGQGGLQAFIAHLYMLSLHYEDGEDALFIKAIAFLWAGVPYSSDPRVALGDITLRNMWRLTPMQQRWPVQLTPYPMLLEGGAGWHPELNDDNNPSHHYALFLYSGYFLGEELSVAVNQRRDPDNPPDLRLGNAAAAHGAALRRSSGTFRMLPSWLQDGFGRRPR